MTQVEGVSTTSWDEYENGVRCHCRHSVINTELFTEIEVNSGTIFIDM